MIESGNGLAVEQLFDMVEFMLGEERQALTRDEGSNILPEVCMSAQFEMSHYGYPLLIKLDCADIDGDEISYEVIDFQPLP
mgnify:CR=1 FL=1